MNFYLDIDMHYVIIPARRASTRLPDKPLLPIHGKPMILWTAERAKRYCDTHDARLIIATDDADILALCQGFDVMMTKKDHACGTDRLFEVAKRRGLADDTIVVNVQGDEPLIPPDLIAQVVDLLKQNPSADVATLIEPCDSTMATLPSVVKTVVDDAGFALYFSRAMIPSGGDKFWRHLGLYAYRVHALGAFDATPMGALECAESLEQLRFLSMGKKIITAPACVSLPKGVDTPDDLAMMNAIAKDVFLC